MTETSSTFVNRCIVCGRITLGPQLRLIPDGPPLGVCGQHQAMLSGDPHSYIVYCMHCQHSAFILHVDAYTGDRLLFIPDCPTCNPKYSNTNTIQAQTWNSMMMKSSGNSSPRSETDTPSTSMERSPDGS